MEKMNAVVEISGFLKNHWPVALSAAAFVCAAFCAASAALSKRRLRALEREMARKDCDLAKKSKKLEDESRALEEAKNDSENVLSNILPKSVAKKLSENPNIIIADKHDFATILFSDIVGFTKLSSTMNAAQVVTMLNDLFTLFDMRAEAEGVEKIKTIGDAYMAVCGLDARDAEDGAVAMMNFARGMLEDLRNFNLTTGLGIEMRIGINTGPIVAGVIGKTKFIYDVWGDAVNLASRMESTGLPGRIHVSESAFDVARGWFKFEGPVRVSVKGKGVMRSYYAREDGAP